MIVLANLPACSQLELLVLIFLNGAQLRSKGAFLCMKLLDGVHGQSAVVGL